MGGILGLRPPSYIFVMCAISHTVIISKISHGSFPSPSTSLYYSINSWPSKSRSLSIIANPSPLTTISGIHSVRYETRYPANWRSPSALRTLRPLPLVSPCNDKRCALGQLGTGYKHTPVFRSHRTAKRPKTADVAVVNNT